MKRGVLFILLLLVLCSQIVLAADTAEGPSSGGGGGDQARQTPDQVEDKAKTDYDVNLAGAAEGDVVGDDGIWIHGSTKVNLNDFRGSTITVSGKDIIIDGQRISGASTISKSGGTIITDGALTVVADGHADIIATHVGTFQAGPVVITNGVNVKYIDGCLSADSADSLVETDTVATKIDNLNYCEKTIDVKEADSVWAGCVFMEGVEDASITAGTEVEVTAEAGSEFAIKDCATNQYDFKALSDDRTHRRPNRIRKGQRNRTC
jgi:hypothetical protein